MPCALLAPAGQSPAPELCSRSRPRYFSGKSVSSPLNSHAFLFRAHGGRTCRPHPGNLERQLAANYASAARGNWKEAGRPTAGRPGGPAAPLPGDRPPGTCAQIFSQNFLHKSPCRPAAGRPGPGRPAAGRPGYIPVNFENENIFL